ncbi:MAG: MATE family efflux transporter [Lachnospiraceae bacterium]|nr:MATE family efflux transporter [Lachnospiraceae bacterium]
MKMENDLGHDPVRSLVLRIAIPSMLAQFVSVLYSIVDRMYIGNIPQVGDLALAGAGICGPIVTMIGSVASLVGMGGSPLMSISMGQKEMQKAKEILSTGFVMLLAGAVLLLAFLMPVRRQMLLFFGASEVTLPYAMDYYTMYLAGTFFALLSLGLNQFIIAQGFARVGMCSVLLGAVSNIILDPVFIFLFGMGVGGAAAATVLSQLASALFVLRFLRQKDIPVRLSFRGFRWKLMKKILAIGMTPFLIIALDNVMIIVMNMVLQHYGGAGQGDMLITCATIAQSFMLIVTMPLGGISAGTQSILGYNYGAGNMDRVKSAQKYIILLCVLYTSLMFLMARLLGESFVSLFTRDAGVAENAFRAIRICTLSIVPLGVQYAIVDGFTGMGKVQISLPLSFFRKGVYFAVLFLAPALWGAGAAFYAETVSDLIPPVVSAVVYFVVMKKM